MAKRQDTIPGYLYAPDGLRAVSVILIFIFHTWQQSWIFYRLQLTENFTLFDFTMFQQYGFLAIDFFFVLSGFGLFYPIARTMFGESQFRGWKDYFLKRARRIYPSYVIGIIILLLIPSALFVYYDKSNPADVIKNIITNMLFIQNVTNTSITPIISTAWTLPMEVHFYILFPLVCIPFRKKPVLTFIGMAAVALAVRLGCICFTDLRQVQQGITPGYFDVFGCGMLAAYFVVYARNKMKHTDKMKPMMTVMSVICIFIIGCFFKWIGSTRFPAGSDGTVYFRFLYRGIMDLAVAGFLFTACFSYDFWQKKIWGNRLFIFLSSISYTVYLWHQNVYIFLKNNNLPYSAANPVMNDRAAMEGMTLICAVVSIAAGVLITKFIEQPIAKYGYKGCFEKLTSPFRDNKKK